MIMCTMCMISQGFLSDDLIAKKNSSSSSSSSYCCKKGKKGRTGKVGRQGDSGRADINDIIEVTTQVTNGVGGSLISFSNPITYPVNGIDRPLIGGMTLEESVPVSGNFDIITLPIEKKDTFYLVTYGASVGIESSGEFQLVLNGTPLPYTTIGISFDEPHTMKSRTSVVINPANTAGTLSLLAASEFTTIDPATEDSFSAYMTVVKLNSNF